MKYLGVLFLLVITLNACYYDVEQELYPGIPCVSANMSYANDIVPLLTRNGCLGCHGDLATLDLNGYTDFKVYVDNGAVQGSINHEAGFRPMPDNMPKISSCDIEKINSWINAGAPNN